MGALFSSTNVAWQGLNFLRQNVKSLVLLSSTPGNLAACTNATHLCLIAGSVSSANFGTCVADSTTVGFKTTITSFVTIVVTTTGDATCLALYNTDSSAGTTGLHYYTKCSVNLASTLNSVSIQSWKITIADPTT